MESTSTPAAREPFADWTLDQRTELQMNTANPQVGTRLLLEDQRARVWEIRLAPGERLTFHRHVLDYVWTCVSGGNAISRDEAGNTNRVDYEVAETRALSFGKGQSMIHDLENVGSADIVFTTVEFLDSDNDPLPLACGS
jgi:predicted metal-dependent enzyme (double-stranded beta helix superfamily)